MCCSALEPLEPHIIGPGHIGGHGANGKAIGGVVVVGDWYGLCLRVPRFFKRCAVRHGALASTIMLDDGRQDVYCFVCELYVAVFGHVVVGGRSTLASYF